MECREAYLTYIKEYQRQRRANMTKEERALEYKKQYKRKKRRKEMIKDDSGKTTDSAVV